EFTLDRPVDVAAQDVRDKVSRVRGRLPVDVLEPVIAKQSADAQPFFWLALSSDNYDLMQLSDVADRLVKARLQSLPGVGSAQIFGERRYSMRVWVEPRALSARGLDRKSTRLNSSHLGNSYAVFCLKKKTCESLALRPSAAR